MTFSRRHAIAAGLSTVGAGLTAWPTPSLAAGLTLGPATPFSFEALKARARSMAMRPFAPPTARADAALEALDYDAMGQIRFRPEAALWRGLAGADPVEFFLMGRYARTPVSIHVVEGGIARQIVYSEALFDVPAGLAGRAVPPGLGFAGFRVMNATGAGDWIAYQGASYFRAATPFNQYGLSARAIAIDTASTGREEFPAFTSFWLEHDGAGNMVVNALLEGASVVGAYRVVHRKTAAGLIQDVEAAVSFRGPVKRLGVAPLTSMFWYGQPDRSKATDWRPQIHDSDGLAMWTGSGERIWRPLANPPRVVTNTFSDADPRGFGLMQRDRVFDDYQDDGVFYDRRPSAWVEPVGAWGAGSVQLVEIPTSAETDDNIVAFWTPARTIGAGDAMDWRYRLHWTSEEPTPVGVAKVVATRVGEGGRPGQAPAPGMRKFVVDFAGGRLAGLDARSGVQSVVAVDPGQALESAAYPVVGTARWRVMFDAAVAPGNVVDLRAFLRLGAESLTETWIYQAFGT
jgi:periplasmic glucans biosynthesis protein